MLGWVSLGGGCRGMSLLWAVPRGPRGAPQLCGCPQAAQELCPAPVLIQWCWLWHPLPWQGLMGAWGALCHACLCWEVPGYIS